MVRGFPKVRMWMPRWSPNGEWLAFISQEAGHDHLWMVRPDGSEARQVTQEPLDISDIDWAPDGSSIAATLNRDSSFELVLIDPSSGEVTGLHTETGFHQRPRWTPDGKVITFEFESPVQTADIFSLDMETPASSPADVFPAACSSGEKDGDACSCDL